jgi:hypothetical protein
MVLSAMVLSAMVLSTAATFAQGRIDNARTETRTVTRGLEQEVAAVASRAEAAWVAYRAPMVAGPRQMCCDDGGRCRLEGSGVSMSLDDLDRLRGSRVMLEPPSEFHVFARVANGQVGRVRTFTPDCEIDAVGMAVVWLEEVGPADSIAWLSTLVGAVGSVTGDERYDRVAKPAVAAIALHDVPDADRALESFMAPTRPAELREDTTFWIGSARGESGVRLLTRVIANDPSTDVREKAVFGLSVSRTPAALQTLITTATSDGNADVRGRALFWLAQKAGQQAAAAITNAIANDPDTEVKKKAVFALSQMPKDEGIPKLIEVARTNRNPDVRKQAMFWLGQSKDPRAARFFAEILASK